MKKRWSVLFWCALTPLIAGAWLASRLGFGSPLMGIGSVGMVVATCIAFFAMIQATPLKWPAFAVVLCTAPECLSAIQFVSNFDLILRYFGIPGLLMMVATIATMCVAIWILVSPVPPPPRVPEARVVD